jgi:hypothetical protein
MESLAKLDTPEKTVSKNFTSTSSFMGQRLVADLMSNSSLTFFINASRELFLTTIFGFHVSLSTSLFRKREKLYIQISERGLKGLNEVEGHA